MLLVQEAQVQSLVEILRFYMPCGAAGKSGVGGTKKPDQQQQKKHRSVAAKSEGAGWNGLRRSEGTKFQL